MRPSTTSTSTPRAAPTTMAVSPARRSGLDKMASIGSSANQRASRSAWAQPGSVRPGSAGTGLGDLDRLHPELARRLEVRAEVVEEHGGGRRDVEPLADEGVDARVGLA